MGYQNKPMKWPTAPRTGIVLSLALTLLAGCAQPTAPSSGSSPTWSSREAALAASLPMPAAESYDSRYFTWEDASRSRPVLAKLYLPAGATKPVPLIVFSHGIGGSREGYTYLGKHWAAQGVASLHLQHVGSDRSIWTGNPLAIVSRLQEAARESEAIDRAVDVRFALDQLLSGPDGQRVDAGRIAAAGHSYGANTTLLVAGATVERNGQSLQYRDPRVKTAILISAPPFYGESRLDAILGPVQIPTLHITATADDIRIPGYFSGVQDRTAVYAATGSRHKWLAVFKDGSHSIFTDRLGTGGEALNPQVKAATRELALDFLQFAWGGASDAVLTDWQRRYQPLVAQVQQQ